MKTLLRSAIALLVAIPACSAPLAWVPNNPKGAQVDFVLLENAPNEFGSIYLQVKVALVGDSNTYVLFETSESQWQEISHALIEARSMKIPVVLEADPETRIFYAIRYGDSDHPLAINGLAHRPGFAEAAGFPRFDVLGRNLPASRASAPAFRIPFHR